MRPRRPASYQFCPKLSGSICVRVYLSCEREDVSRIETLLSGWGRSMPIANEGDEKKKRERGKTEQKRQYKVLTVWAGNVIFFFFCFEFVWDRASLLFALGFAGGTGC